MASKNLYNSGYFGSSPQAEGGGGYQPAYSSPYSLQSQQSPEASAVTPTTTSSPYNSHSQTGARGPPVTPTKRGLGNISSSPVQPGSGASVYHAAIASPYNFPHHQGEAGIMAPTITPTKLASPYNNSNNQGQLGEYRVPAGAANPYYNDRSQSMVGYSPIAQSTIKSPSPAKSLGQSELETDPFASIPNAPYPLGRARFSLPPLVGQSTGLPASIGYMGEGSLSAGTAGHYPMSSSYAVSETSTPATMTKDPSRRLQFLEAVASSKAPTTIELSREIKVEASKTDPSKGYGWIEIEVPQASMLVDHTASSIDLAMSGKTQNIPAIAPIAPANPYYVAPQLTTTPTNARKQVQITSEALREAYRAINYLTRIGDIQKKDCNACGTHIKVPTWLSSAELFKAALVFPFDHSFHGTGAGTPVDPEDIELGIWEKFGDNLDKYYSMDCRCFFRYDDPFGFTRQRDPFEEERVSPPEHCAFCTLGAHLEKARKYVDSLDSSAVEPNLLSQAGQSQAGPSQAGPSHAGCPSQAGTLQAGQIELAQWSGNKHEMWYWVETSKVNAFLYGSFPEPEAQKLATSWKQASGSVARLHDMANTLLKAVDEMRFHLYMGILVPLCHKWCQHPEFKKFSTGNAKSRRQFWRLRMIDEPDCVQKWLECLDVLIDPKAFAKKFTTDTPWDTRVKSSLKMWTERVFLMSMDLVFVEIVAHTYVKGYHPNFVKNTQDLDLGHYSILNSRPWKFVDLLNDPDVKQFEVHIDNWYIHSLTPATGLAAHIRASQLISASCVAGRPSSQRVFVGGTTGQNPPHGYQKVTYQTQDGHTETGYWYNDRAGLNLDVFHRGNIP